MRKITIYFLALLILIPSLLFSGTEEMLFKAKQFYYQNKFHLAREILEKALNKDPLNFNDEACLLLGNIYNHQGEYTLAIKLFERGSEITTPKKKIIFYLNLAQAYRHAKKYVKSLNTLKKIEMHKEKHPEIFLFTGMAYFHLRNKEETIKNWETYIEKVPTGAQSETIKKAIAWLKLPTFQWPEEIERQRRGPQGNQNPQRIAELERQKKEQEERARKFLAELKKQRERERLRRLREERDNVRIRTGQITPNDRGREEGQRYDVIER